MTLPATPAPLLPSPATKALLRGEPQNAFYLFEKEISQARGERRKRLHLGAGTAAYQIKDYRNAQRHYSNALLSSNLEVQKHSHFGLGNSSFYRGLDSLSALKESSKTLLHWSDAIAHFSAVVKIDPSNQKASENLAYVRKRLEQYSAQLLNDPLKEKNQKAEDPPTSPEQKDPETGDPSNPSDTPVPTPSHTPPPSPNTTTQEPPLTTPPDEVSSQEPSKNTPQGKENPNPGETAQEFARRVLRDNADLETMQIPRRLSQGPRPKKDW